MKKITVIIFLFSAQLIWSNNLTISNVTKLSDTELQFDVTWDNSWNSNGYYDAAWIFIKIKGSDGTWRHLDISSASVTADFDLMPIPTDKKGFFIRRSTLGTGTVSGGVVVDFATSPYFGPFPDFKIFGVEMVHINSGSFYIGDGSTVTQTKAFSDGASSGVGSNAYLVSSLAGGLPIGTNAGELFANSLITNIPLTFIPETYPTGYDSFYIMKYEISAEQYAEFLNTLTALQQQARTKTDLAAINVNNRFVMSNQSFAYNRNSIACDANANPSGVLNYATPPLTFYCDYNNNQVKNEAADGQNIACSQLTFNHNLAYLDWAALRPITDMEYEKAARGFATYITGEFANGSTQIVESGSVVNQGLNNETVSNLNSNYLVNYFGTSSFGPIRVGAFASTGTNRIQSGGSYFGVMDLAGNIAEFAVETRNVNSTNLTYTGNLGDGSLNSDGNSYEWTSFVDYFVSKGGDFITQNTAEFTVSYRANSFSSAFFNNYNANALGNVRGCR